MRRAVQQTVVDHSAHLPCINRFDQIALCHILIFSVPSHDRANGNNLLGASVRSNREPGVSIRNINMKGTMRISLGLLSRTTRILLDTVGCKRQAHLLSIQHLRILLAITSNLLKTQLKNITTSTNTINSSTASVMIIRHIQQ